MRDPAVRLAVDVGKVAARDGIGSFTRGLVGALVREASERGHDEWCEPVEIVFVDLLEAEPRATIETALAKLLTPVGPVSATFLDATELDSRDVLLCTTWRRPPRVDGRALFVVYDLTFLTLPDCHTVENRIRCLDGCLHAALATDRLIAISEATADDAAHHLGVARADIEVVHPAPAETFRPREDAAARVAERHGLERADDLVDPRGFVLAVGSFEPRKNLELLLDAHRRLPPPLASRFPLAVVGGDGWHNERLLGRLAEAEERGSVRRLGRVDDEELADLYSAATVFAYPSRAEGFGLPVAEAMACGCPVVAADLPVLREVAGDAARYVPVDRPDAADRLATTLAGLLDNPEERRRLVAKGLERVGRFTWDRAARRVLELLDLRTTQ